MLNKNKVIYLLKHLKQRYNLTAAQWAQLLGIGPDIYKNIIYKNTLSADTMLTVLQKMDVLVKAQIIILDYEELEALA